MKIYLDMVGCKLNQSEIEAYARQFRQAGHEIVGSASGADLVVINTCAVTAEATSDSRQKIRQAARTGCAGVVVTGCWSTLDPRAAANLPGVTRVVPNSVKDGLVNELLEPSRERFDLEPLDRSPLPGLRKRTRAFIKIQDGCNNRCTFCVTSLARGPARSRTTGDILEDIHAAVAGGAREIVLTGVHLGSWGHDLPASARLESLIGIILAESRVDRLRLSSLEPWDLDERFFHLWEDQRLCRHLHLPLQSGSATTLRRMARKVTPDGYAALVELARQKVPDIAITTDLIAGFPGETVAEFEESLDFVRRLDFSGGHVFRYSPRPGTAAASYPDAVPGPISRHRSVRLRELLAQGEEAYVSRFLGSEVEVLWESAHANGQAEWVLSGLTGNYLRVSAPAPQPLWNQVSRVRLDTIQAGAVSGSIRAI